MRSVTVDGLISFKTSMNCARSAFGCSLSKQLGIVIVAGGQVNPLLGTSRCEKYDIQSDTWAELPSLNEAKCSTSLCIIANIDGAGRNFVYSFGGLCRSKTSISMTDTIERLDLNTLISWTVLPIKMLEGGVDFGSIVRKCPDSLSR